MIFIYKFMNKLSIVGLLSAACAIAAFIVVDFGFFVIVVVIVTASSVVVMIVAHSIEQLQFEGLNCDKLHRFRVACAIWVQNRDAALGNKHK